MEKTLATDADVPRIYAVSPAIPGFRIRNPGLIVEDLRSGYGPIEVLKGISLRVDAGEIVAVIGANGAGKTTTLGTISGLIAARGGSISFGTHDLTAIPAHKIVRAGIAHCPEGRKIFPKLTVLENLEMGAFTRDNRAEVKEDLEKAYHYFPILKSRQKQTGGTLSGGEQQMLAIARALMSRPTLLMLDEPSLGLAPMIVVRIFEVIAELNRTGMSVLLVEQNARMALKLAHRGYVMETGSIVIEAPASVLLDDCRVKAAYLGE